MSYVTLYVLFVAAAQTVATLHMLYLRRNHSTILAWFMAILMFPFPAVIFYFVFGNRKIRQKSKKKLLLMHEKYRPDRLPPNPVETVLSSHGVAATTLHNDVRLCFEGSEAYSLLLDEIAKAYESIWISTYILKNDGATRVILQMLTEKAAKGLDVRLLIDAVGSYTLYFWQKPLRSFREAGGKAVFFMPILKHPLKNYINLRNHRKIYLFDGRTVLSGGMNLGEEYMGPRPGKNRWVDMIFRIEGEAVYPYAEIFLADFVYASGEIEQILPRKLPPAGNSPVQVVPSGPDMSSDALYETLLSAIHSAQNRVWIVTPYFVPDDTILKALIIARHKGVDVKLITPSATDHWIADIGRSSYMREAEENGMEVLLYNGNMLHTKAIVFDDYAVMLGSVNIDNRSLFLNYEVVSFVYARGVIEETERWIRGLMAQSIARMRPVSRGRIVLENFMRIFSPQL